MEFAKKLLEIAGLGKERLHLEWCSSAEARRFADICQGVTENVRAQGPLDLSGLGLQLDAAEATAGSETLRWLVGKQVALLDHGDVFGRACEPEDFNRVLENALAQEYHKRLIALALRLEAGSVRDLQRRTGLDLLRISKLLTEMEKGNEAVFKGHREGSPVFEPP